MIDAMQASSGRSPDLVAKERSRDGVSSAAAAMKPLEPYSRHGRATTALDTGGSASLPAVSTSTNLTGWRLLTADDVAVILRVPRSLVYALARRGDLPLIRIGERYIRFRAEAIERWLERQEAWDTQPSATSPPDRRMTRTGGSPSTTDRRASGTSLRRRANAPGPGIRRVGPDAS